MAQSRKHNFIAFGVHTLTQEWQWERVAEFNLSKRVENERVHVFVCITIVYGDFYSVRCTVYSPCLSVLPSLCCPVTKGREGCTWNKSNNELTVSNRFQCVCESVCSCVLWVCRCRIRNLYKRILAQRTSDMAEDGTDTWHKDMPRKRGKRSFVQSTYGRKTTEMILVSHICTWPNCTKHTESNRIALPFRSAVPPIPIRVLPFRNLIETKQMNDRIL